MFRDIANRVAGRRKSKDESLNLREATELLGGLNSSIKGNISYHEGFTEFAVGDVAPREMVDFVERKFSTDPEEYLEIQHQVYSGRSGDKHYLKMSLGYIDARFGAEEVRSKPYKKASIDFLVQKE
jgi:hypothetical protein